MPSRYEPCGLGQLIALRYGTIPVVFKTGGLADTVEDSNGFIFDSYSSTDLVKAIKIAVKTFSNKKKWYSLVLQAMKRDFSWKASTGEYLKLYEKARLR
jgi:starch synthase